MTLVVNLYWEYPTSRWRQSRKTGRVTCGVIIYDQPCAVATEVLKEGSSCAGESIVCRGERHTCLPCLKQAGTGRRRHYTHPCCVLLGRVCGRAAVTLPDGSAVGVARFPFGISGCSAPYFPGKQ